MNASLRKAAVIALILASLPGLASARGRRLKPKEEFKPPYDMIAAVDAAAQTFTISHVNSTNTNTRTFKVDKLTEFQVNGEKGTFAGVQTGMKVSVTPAMDDIRASRVVVSPAPIETPSKR